MAIKCNFARTAIHHFTSRFMTKQNKIPRGSMILIVQEYSTHFTETPNLTLTCSVASKKFPPIARKFSDRWNPSETKHHFLSTFTIPEWNTLAPEEKANHTLRDCQVCQTKYQHLSMAFPGMSKKPLRPPQITFSQGDFSTPQQFGSKLLSEANSLTKHTFNKPITDVIEETPKSNLIKKPTSSQRLKQKRNILREIKQSIQNEMDDKQSHLRRNSDRQRDCPNNILKLHN